MVQQEGLDSEGHLGGAAMARCSRLVETILLSVPSLALHSQCQ